MRNADVEVDFPDEVIPVRVDEHRLDIEPMEVVELINFADELEPLVLEVVGDDGGDEIELVEVGRIIDDDEVEVDMQGELVME